MNIDKRFTIEIDNKEVELRINKTALMLHSKHFRRNIVKVLEEYININDLDNYLNDAKNLMKAGTQLSQIVWTFAKNANHRIPSYKKWIESFEEFPVKEIFPKIAKELNKDVK